MSRCRPITQAIVAADIAKVAQCLGVTSLTERAYWEAGGVYRAQRYRGDGWQWRALCRLAGLRPTIHGVHTLERVKRAPCHRCGWRWTYRRLDTGIWLCGPCRYVLDRARHMVGHPPPHYIPQPQWRKPCSYYGRLEPSRLLVR